MDRFVISIIFSLHAENSNQLNKLCVWTKWIEFLLEFFLRSDCLYVFVEEVEEEEVNL